MDSELCSLVAEFMKEKGLNSTVEVFKEDLKKKGILLNCSSKIQQNGIHLKVLKIEELMVAFECGEQEAFFVLWSELVPSQLLQNDPTCQDLEFALTVYFALYPLKHNIGDIHVAMSQFKEYLDKNGTYLAKLPSFAVYCALPYIPDPSSHPTFKHLFTDGWKKEVHSRLEEFLRVSCMQSNDAVTLEDLYYSFATCDEKDILYREVKSCRSKYQALAEVAIELVETLESSVAGKQITTEYIEVLCQKLLKVSHCTVPIISWDPADTPANFERPKSALQESVESLRQSISTPLTSFASVSNYPTLDFTRLKHDLLILPNESKVVLLKALRWRLTRSQPGMARDSAINGYIMSDILGVRNTSRSSESVLDFVSYKDKIVKEHFCRLLNSLSSMRIGRDYLQSCTALNHTLCKLLISLHEESPILRNVLGTVQKLSLRRPLQSSMIEEGLLEWVVNLLNDCEGLSDYTLRYSLALLMNLCLRQEGKVICVKISPKPLQMLSELLEHENNEVRSYVNGILYSLLGVPELRAAAIKMDMQESLQSAMRISPPDLQSQLKYIITRLEEPFVNDNGGNTDEANEAEDCDEEGDPEAVDGDDDNTEDDETSMDGEEILRSYYTQTSFETIESLSMPLSRPITPHTQLRASTAIGTGRPFTSHGKLVSLLPIEDCPNRPKTS